MAEHIVYDNGLKYTFRSDETYNAYHNGEAFFDENQTLRRKDNGQICESVKVEADDRFDCDGIDDDYSNNDEDMSSYQYSNTSNSISDTLLKILYIYLSNEEVRNTVNELVKCIAPKAKAFFCNKILPSLKKGFGKIKNQTIKLFNKFIGKPNSKSKQQTPNNANSTLVEKFQESKQSDKKIHMTNDEVAQEQEKILFCLYTIIESSEKLKNAKILDAETLLKELSTPAIIKQSKQYMKKPKTLPSIKANEINLVNLPETKQSLIRIDSKEENNE